MPEKEKTAKADFKHIQSNYNKLNKNIVKLQADMEAIIIQTEDLKKKIGTFEKKKAEAKTTKTVEKYLGEILLLEKEFEKILKEKDKIGKELEKSGESIKYFNNLFAERIPKGKELLEEMKKADIEKRMNVKQAALNVKEVKLIKEGADLALVYENLNLDPNLKKIFNDLVKYPKNSAELLAKAASGKITPAEQNKLNQNKKEFDDNKKEIKKYFKDVGITGFDFKAFELNLFKDLDLSVEDNVKLLMEDYNERRNDFNIEKETIQQYYIEKLKTFESKQKELEEELEEELDEDKDLDLSKPSLWSRFKNRVTNFFNKFRKQKEELEEKSEEKEELEEKPEEKEEPEYSKKFMDDMGKSNYFKEEIRKAAEIEDKEIAEKIAENKRKAAEEKAKETPDDLER